MHIGRDASAWRGLAHSRLILALLTLAALAPATSHAGAQYVYDQLGRIADVISSDGSVIHYQYDPDGNIVAIDHIGASTLSVAGFSPSAAYTGYSITVSGTGFSTTPALNAVVVGGVSATVSAATATSLTVTVPYGASTGVISVTVSGVTANSSTSIVILKPAITDFSPKVVDAGTTVTLTGSNLDLVPGSTTVLVGGVQATVSSTSNTQLQFSVPVQTRSGLVQVVSSYGQATSSEELMIPPPAIGAANVASYEFTSPGGRTTTLTCI